MFEAITPLFLASMILLKNSSQLADDAGTRNRNSTHLLCKAVLNNGLIHTQLVLECKSLNRRAAGNGPYDDVYRLWRRPQWRLPFIERLRRQVGSEV
jgi:hypothetical protein